MTSLLIKYLIYSEQSLATHGASMMRVVAEAVADGVHFNFAGAKKSNSCRISKYYRKIIRIPPHDCLQLTLKNPFSGGNHASSSPRTEINLQRKPSKRTVFKAEPF